MAGPNDNNFRRVPKPYSLYAQILEVKGGENLDAVKKTYRKLAGLYHPDRNKGSKQAEAKFKALNEAYTHFVTYLKTNKTARAPLTYAQAAGLLGVKGGETLKQVDDLYAAAVKNKGPLDDIHEANHIMLYQIFRAKDHRTKVPEGSSQEPPHKPPQPPVNEGTERLTTTQMAAARSAGTPSTDVRPPRQDDGTPPQPPRSPRERPRRKSTVTAPVKGGVEALYKIAGLSLLAVGYFVYCWSGFGYNRNAPFHRLAAGKAEAKHVEQVIKDRLPTTRMATSRVLNDRVFAKAQALTLAELESHAKTYDESPYKGIDENRFYTPSAKNKKDIFRQGHMPYFEKESMGPIGVKVGAGSADRVLGGEYKTNASEVLYSVIASPMTDELKDKLTKEGITVDQTTKVYSVRGAVSNITPFVNSSEDKGVRWSSNPETQEQNQMDYNAKCYSLDASVHQRIETPQGSYVVSPDGKVTVLKTHKVGPKQAKTARADYSTLKGETGSHGLDAARPTAGKGNEWNRLSGTISQLAK